MSTTLPPDRRFPKERGKTITVKELLARWTSVDREFLNELALENHLRPSLNNRPIENAASLREAGCPPETRFHCYVPTTDDSPYLIGTARHRNSVACLFSALPDEAAYDLPSVRAFEDDHPNKRELGIARGVAKTPSLYGKEGGRASRVNSALQDAITRIVQDLRSKGIPKPTLGELKHWLADRKAVTKPRPGYPVPYSFESSISNCDELYIDGDRLVWTDRAGKEQSITFSSLRRYLDGANSS